MKAVVLAAGKGTRLQALTAEIPKPMLPVGGRPVIDRVLSLLAADGVNEVFINLHHQKEAIAAYCGSGERWGVRITYAVESQLLGTAGAVRNLCEHLRDAPFFVVYGDNYLDCDLSALRTLHRERQGVATIGLFEKDDTIGSGVVELDENGRVVRFVEKPRRSEAFGNLVNGGVYVLSPSIIELIPSCAPCDFGYDVFPALLASGYPVYGLVLKGAVWPIDTPDLYRRLCERMSNEHP